MFDFFLFVFIKYKKQYLILDMIIDLDKQKMLIADNRDIDKVSDNVLSSCASDDAKETIVEVTCQKEEIERNVDLSNDICFLDIDNNLANKKGELINISSENNKKADNDVLNELNDVKTNFIRSVNEIGNSNTNDNAEEINLCQNSNAEILHVNQSNSDIYNEQKQIDNHNESYHACYNVNNEQQILKNVDCNTEDAYLDSRFYDFFSSKCEKQLLSNVNTFENKKYLYNNTFYDNEDSLQKVHQNISGDETNNNLTVQANNNTTTCYESCNNVENVYNAGESKILQDSGNDRYFSVEENNELVARSEHEISHEKALTNYLLFYDEKLLDGNNLDFYKQQNIQNSNHYNFNHDRFDNGAESKQNKTNEFIFKHKNVDEYHNLNKSYSATPNISSNTLMPDLYQYESDINKSYINVSNDYNNTYVSAELLDQYENNHDLLQNDFYNQYYSNTNNIENSTIISNACDYLPAYNNDYYENQFDLFDAGYFEKVDQTNLLFDEVCYMNNHKIFENSNYSKSFYEANDICFDECANIYESYKVNNAKADESRTSDYDSCTKIIKLDSKSNKYKAKKKKKRKNDDKNTNITNYNTLQAFNEYNYSQKDINVSYFGHFYNNKKQYDTDNCNEKLCEESTGNIELDKEMISKRKKYHISHDLDQKTDNEVSKKGSLNTSDCHLQNDAKYATQIENFSNEFLAGDLLEYNNFYFGGDHNLLEDKKYNDNNIMVQENSQRKDRNLLLPVKSLTNHKNNDKHKNDTKNKQLQIHKPKKYKKFNYNDHVTKFELSNVQEFFLPTNNDIYKNSTCNSMFKSGNRNIKYEEFYKKQNKKLKEFNCIVYSCNKVYSSITAMRYHLKLKHGKVDKEEKPLKCLSFGCNKTFKSRGGLSYHKRKHHTRLQ